MSSKAHVVNFRWFSTIIVPSTHSKEFDTVFLRSFPLKYCSLPPVFQNFLVQAFKAHSIDVLAGMKLVPSLYDANVARTRGPAHHVCFVI
jgi:hypothetical protein